MSIRKDMLHACKVSVFIVVITDDMNSSSAVSSIPVVAAVVPVPPPITAQVSPMTNTPMPRPPNQMGPPPGHMGLPPPMGQQPPIPITPPVSRPHGYMGPPRNPSGPNYMGLPHGQRPMMGPRHGFVPRPNVPYHMLPPHGRPPPARFDNSSQHRPDYMVHQSGQRMPSGHMQYGGQLPRHSMTVGMGARSQFLPQSPANLSQASHTSYPSPSPVPSLTTPGLVPPTPANLGLVPSSVSGLTPVPPSSTPVPTLGTVPVPGPTPTSAIVHGSSAPRKVSSHFGPPVFQPLPLMGQGLVSCELTATDTIPSSISGVDDAMELEEQDTAFDADKSDIEQGHTVVQSKEAPALSSDRSASVTSGSHPEDMLQLKQVAEGQDRSMMEDDNMSIEEDEEHPSSPDLSDPSKSDDLLASRNEEFSKSEVEGPNIQQPASVGNGVVDTDVCAQQSGVSQPPPLASHLDLSEADVDSSDIPG